MRSVAEIDSEIARVKQEMEDARGAECEVYARIVGYYRSVKNWYRAAKLSKACPKGHRLAGQPASLRQASFKRQGQEGGIQGAQDV